MAQVGDLVRSLPYPIIEEGNLSYPNGEYQVEITPQQGGVSVLLNHTVKGAPLLEHLISKGKAKYGCLVSVPLTGYRKLHLSDDARQRVEWDGGVVGEPPMLRPVIVSVEKVLCTLGPGDGVAKAWLGREIKIPKGARLALKSYLRPTSSLHHLLHVVQGARLSGWLFPGKAMRGGRLLFQSPCGARFVSIPAKCRRTCRPPEERTDTRGEQVS